MIRSVPRIFVYQAAYENAFWRWTAQPYQNSVTRMMDHLRKLSEFGDFLLPIFDGTLSTTKAFLFLDEKKRLVVCKIDSCCVEDSVVALVEFYSCQVLNEAYDLEHEEKWINSARVYVSNVKCWRCKTLLCILGTLSGLQSVRMVQEPWCQVCVCDIGTTQ